MYREFMVGTVGYELVSIWMRGLKGKLTLLIFFARERVLSLINRKIQSVSGTH
jgi:hypothetical protein